MTCQEVYQSVCLVMLCKKRDIPNAHCLTISAVDTIGIIILIGSAQGQKNAYKIGLILIII